MRVCEIVLMPPRHPIILITSKFNMAAVSVKRSIVLLGTAEISRPTTGFSAKWRLRNERKNFILMTRHYPDPNSTLIGWSKISANQKHYPDPGSVASFIKFLRSLFRRHFVGKSPWRRRKCKLFSQTIAISICLTNWIRFKRTSALVSPYSSRTSRVCFIEICSGVQL